MNTIIKTVRQLHNDEGGAAFIEYTALLGVVLAVGIGMFTALGGWIGTQWDDVCTLVGATC
jgi:Flp pilus assembly pilin Flp